ncbi:unnamed protein product [Owenia fusiformis]|uniref:Uncharacterized protein n=1 Tax=Owenia fusiformis TaxID=6347 RepID=A0A8J1XJH6_OWEFU|nr:unnamed protein product [Owenia fusiformis]
MEAIGQYILTTKIALATAIIRSKPDGLTGAQYCASLCSAYTQNTAAVLLEKNKQLEEQVLFLRQKLHIEQSVLPHGAEQPASQQNENEVFLTPPSSSEEQTSAKLEQLKHKFSHHAHFFNSLTPILQISANTNNHTSLEIIKETAESTIEALKETIREKIVSTHVENAMKKAAKALGLLCDGNVKVFQIIRSDIEELVATLINQIMSDEDLNNMDKQHSKSHLLVTLGTCSSLKFIILEVTLKAVIKATTTLQKSTKHSLDPVLHDNLYYLLWSMEEILQAECMASLKERVLVAIERRQIVDHLEEAMLHLTNNYPLVTMYIMKLIHMLEFLQQTEK